MLLPDQVASNEEGIRGSWFTGLIVEMHPTGCPTEALVRYDELLHDSGERARCRTVPWPSRTMA